MAEEVATSEDSIHWEEDLQRLIELEAWSDFDEDSLRVEDDSAEYSFEEQEPLNLKLLWSEDDAGSVGSPSAQLPRTYSGIVKELLTQLDDIEKGLVKDQATKPEVVVRSRVETDSGGDDIQHSMPEASISTPSTDETDGGEAGDQHECTAAAPLARAVPDVCPSEAGAEEKKPKYYHIAHEILTSERSYVRDLRVLEKVVHGAVKTKAKTNRSLFPESAREEIFLNIGEIYALNFDLLQELEELFKQWDTNTVVAKVIASRAQFYKLYSVYAMGFHRAQKAYLRWLKSSKEFKKLIKIIESHPFCNGNPVYSFLIIPIQRVPRYKLLLQDYLEHLPKDHPDVKNTEAALAVISETAGHMNSAIADLESEALMSKIQQRLIGKESILAPGRKFIGRGLVTLAGRGRMEKRVFFLFSDILLVTSSTPEMMYKINSKFYLKSILVKDLKDKSTLKNAFLIAAEGTRKIYRFCTESAKDKDLWMKKLKIGRLANREHFTVNETSKYAEVLHDPETYKAIRAVLNDPAFEYGQPSWIRRTGSMRVPGSWNEIDYEMEEIKTEFEDEEQRERALLTMSLKPGMDNSLSSYMNQRSAKGGDWKRRWFVLTNRALVAYKDHMNDESMGAIPLSGYKLSLPTTADVVEEQKLYVFKLTHSRNPGYFFELPSSYAFEKWCSTLKELLDSTANL